MAKRKRIVITDEVEQALKGRMAVYRLAMSDYLATVKSGNPSHDAATRVLSAIREYKAVLIGESIGKPEHKKARKKGRMG